ncbi:MAG: methyl-accepting chemotaxis protein [Candidatus Sulfotelmatobacter sp.]
MKLTLGKKLGLGFASILALMVLSAALTYMKASAIRETQERAMTVRVPTIKALTDLQRDLNQAQSKGRQIVLMGSDSARRDTEMGVFASNWDEIGKDIARLDELSPNWSLQANRDRLAETKRQLPLLRGAQESAMKHATSNERDAVIKAGNEFADRATPVNEAMKKPLGDMADSFATLLKQDSEGMNTETRSMNLTMFGTTFAAIAIGVFLAIFLSRSISGATQSVLAQAEAIAAGDLTRVDLQIRSRDELGDLTTAINKMSASLKTMILAITENAQHVASASEELNATSQQISANSEETSAQAGVVSQASQQVNQNLQSVSTGAEEMTATIQSIASNAHEAATVASKAVQTAQQANATVGKLGGSSAEIGEVIKVITSIAQQTNLLALNATIEAARAGEAVKGFAVVANEVKELAKQTAKATEDISRKINAIQTDTKGAVEAIGSITGVITQINDISGTIATAVEEQSATTNEMTRNVADAAKGSGEITQNIAGVAEAARGTSSSAQESQKAASQLAEMAEQLRSLVAQFKIDGSPANASSVQSPRARAAHVGA